MNILMYGLGGSEILISLIIFGFSYWGYKAGSTRKIGGGVGLLLGLMLNFIGLIIIYLSPKVYSVSYQDVPDQLKKYKELFDSNAITEDEYNIQKAKLLK